MRKSKSDMVEVSVCGIPAYALIETWNPYVPGKITGPPEDCYPAEGRDIEFKLYDRKGYPAPWLETKAHSTRSRFGDTVWDDIEQELIQYCEAMDEYYEQMAEEARAESRYYQSFDGEVV